MTKPLFAVCALAVAVAEGLDARSFGARAADDVSGIPETSIATSLPHALADPAGIRRDLASRGITFGVNYIGEVFGVPSGGLNSDSHYFGRLEFVLDADLETLMGLKGLSLHANGYQIHGSSITAESVGSLMPVSYIEALPATRLFEAYIEQSLYEGKVTIRAGQLAADSEFIISDGAAALINGTWGWPSTTAADFPQGGPAYPLATPGARISISPNETYGLIAAIYSGEVARDCPPDADPQRCNPNGLDFPFGDGVTLMAEGFYRYTAKSLPGRIKIGGWYQTGDFENLAHPAIVKDDDHGLYAVVDQSIINLDDNGRNVAVFARIMGAPRDRNLIDFYAEGGITVTGPFSSRPKDLLAIGFAYTGISASAQAADRSAGLTVIRDYESLLEISYTAEIVPGFTIQPDIQHFWNPGGNVPDASGTRAVENALVLGIRSTLNY